MPTPLLTKEEVIAKAQPQVKVETEREARRHEATSNARHWESVDITNPDFRYEYVGDWMKFNQGSLEV